MAFILFYFYFLYWSLFLPHYTNKLPKLAKAVGRRKVSHTCLNEPWCLSIDGNITPSQSNQLPMEEKMKEEDVLIFVKWTLSCCIISSWESTWEEEGHPAQHDVASLSTVQRHCQSRLEVLAWCCICCWCVRWLVSARTFGKTCWLVPTLYLYKQYITVWAIGMPHWLRRPWPWPWPWVPSWSWSQLSKEHDCCHLLYQSTLCEKWAPMVLKARTG